MAGRCHFVMRTSSSTEQIVKERSTLLSLFRLDLAPGGGANARLLTWFGAKIDNIQMGFRHLVEMLVCRKRDAQQ